MGAASYELLYYFIESLASTDISFIVESNFLPEIANKKFHLLKNRYGIDLLQIHCVAQAELLFQRFKSRSESEERHPGHVDRLNYEEFQTTLCKGRDDILNIESKVIEIDTTDFTKIDYRILSETIKSSLTDV